MLATSYSGFLIKGTLNILSSTVIQLKTSVIGATRAKNLILIVFILSSTRKQAILQIFFGGAIIGLSPRLICAYYFCITTKLPNRMANNKN